MCLCVDPRFDYRGCPNVAHAHVVPSAHPSNVQPPVLYMLLYYYSCCIFPVSPLGSLGVPGNREETPTRQRHQNKSEPLGCGAGVGAAATGAGEEPAPSIALGRSIHSDIDHSGALKRNSPCGELTLTVVRPVI